jgi:hypothetical protein
MRTRVKQSYSIDDISWVTDLTKFLEQKFVRAAIKSALKIYKQHEWLTTQQFESFLFEKFTTLKLKSYYVNFTAKPLLESDLGWVKRGNLSGTN